MAKGNSKPWHEVVKLREDVKSGELTLAMFAADLYDVKMGTARSVYRDPKEFFTLTFPASGIRALTTGLIDRDFGDDDVDDVCFDDLAPLESIHEVQPLSTWPLHRPHQSRLSEGQKAPPEFRRGFRFI